MRRPEREHQRTSTYERKRLAKIARNQAKLVELGLTVGRATIGAIGALNASVDSSGRKKRKKMMTRLAADYDDEDEYREEDDDGDGWEEGGEEDGEKGTAPSLQQRRMSTYQKKAKQREQKQKKKQKKEQKKEEKRRKKQEQQEQRKEAAFAASGSQYRGVTRCEREKKSVREKIKWRAQLGEVYLGTWAVQSDAARSYDAEIRARFPAGEHNARLNFPDDATPLPRFVPPQQVRQDAAKIAAAAARAKLLERDAEAKAKRQRASTNAAPSRSPSDPRVALERALVLALRTQVTELLAVSDTLRFSDLTAPPACEPPMLPAMNRDRALAARRAIETRCDSARHGVLQPGCASEEEEMQLCAWAWQRAEGWRVDWMGRWGAGWREFDVDPVERLRLAMPPVPPPVAKDGDESSDDDEGAYESSSEEAEDGSSSEEEEEDEEEEESDGESDATGERRTKRQLTAAAKKRLAAMAAAQSRSNRNARRAKRNRATV
jgi:hypothetical protein